jgi:hypothetical protein
MKKSIAQLTHTMLALAVLALLCCAANTAWAASIGTPSYTATPNSTPLTNDLTNIGLYGDLDWQIYVSGAFSANYHKAGGSSITNFGMVVVAPTTLDGTANRSAMKFAWTDGVAANPSATAYDPSEANNGFRINNAATFAADVNYQTFAFTPGDTKSHVIYLFGYYNNGSLANLQFENSLPGVATPVVVNPSGTGNFIYSVQFQADNPTDALTVRSTFSKTSTAGTLCVLGLEAAAIANYVPPFITWVGNGGKQQLGYFDRQLELGHLYGWGHGRAV